MAKETVRQELLDNILRSNLRRYDILANHAHDAANNHRSVDSLAGSDCTAGNPIT